MLPWEGMDYVAFVIEVCARHIAGWRVSRTAHASFVLDVLEQPIHDRTPVNKASLIHNSDRSSQGRFKRPSQHPNNGGDDVNLQTRVRSVHSEKNTFAWTSTCLAA
jgi:putative transposase